MLFQLLPYIIAQLLLPISYLLIDMITGVDGFLTFFLAS